MHFWPQHAASDLKKGSIKSPTPLALSDEAMSMLFELSTPLSPSDRSLFLARVAAAAWSRHRRCGSGAARVECAGEDGDQMICRAFINLLGVAAAQLLTARIFPTTQI